MSDIQIKVDYVLEKQRTQAHGNHHCHWPGCTRKVAPALWGCREHWYRLPTALRREIWSTFRPGQEESKTPSKAYVEAALKVRSWIESNATSGKGTP
jgi:hypothetical protein